MDTGGFRQGVEENGNQRGDHEDEGGIAHIVQNPAPFQGGELEFFVHVTLSVLFVWESAEGWGKGFREVLPGLQMGHERCQHGGIGVQCLAVQVVKLRNIGSQVMVSFHREPVIQKLRGKPVENLFLELPVGMSQEPDAQGHDAEAAVYITAGNAGIEFCHGRAFPTGQPDEFSTVEGVRGDFSVLIQQKTIKFRFQRNMSGLADGCQPVDKRMAGAVQTVVSQQTVEIGSGSVGSGGFAGHREEFPACLTMEGASQIAGGSFHENIVIEEKCASIENGNIIASLSVIEDLYCGDTVQIEYKNKKGEVLLRDIQKHISF